MILQKPKKKSATTAAAISYDTTKHLSRTEGESKCSTGLIYLLWETDDGIIVCLWCPQQRFGRVYRTGLGLGLRNLQLFISIVEFDVDGCRCASFIYSYEIYVRLRYVVDRMILLSCRKWKRGTQLPLLTCI